MRYRYAYQRTGAPLLTWKGGPPNQSRAADARSLGTMGGLGSLEEPTIALPLPRPGSPEPIGDVPGDVMGTLYSKPVIAASGAALTYHGYKRTGSVGWALLYGILGSAAPMVAVPIALAQGFGKKKGG